MSGFHCMMRHSMRLNRKIHGNPKEGPPPFDLRLFDQNGRETTFYEPGQTYTIRIVGFVHYRGLLLQARLCDDSGFLIGSLKGGHFVEDSNWENYGIRLQQCDPHMQTNDSVTHSDDSRKFLTQLHWTTTEDIGNVQFMLTVCEENEVCWERWRPRTGLLQPHSRKLSPQPIIEQVFTDEKAAAKLADVRKTLKKQLLQRFGTNISMPPRLFRNSVPPISASLDKEAASTIATTVSVANSSYTEKQSFHFREIEKAFTKELSTIEHKETPFRTTGVFSASKESSVSEKLSEESLAKVSAAPRVQLHAMRNTAIHFPSVDAGELKAADLFIGPCENVCKNNATCFEHSDGDIRCACPPGAAGKFCEKNVNECNKLKCKNGAKCVDLWNDYRCMCPNGWMGKNCDRPCQDVYKSCKLWKRQKQCEAMRPTTDFFDKNCAASCNQCKFLKTTIITDRPLAPVLLPLAFLLGVWKTNITGNHNETTDFPVDFPCGSYEETLYVTVTEVMMFGTPSINFTSVAINRDDPSDKHIMHGFLTIRQYPENSQLAALTSVSNVGLQMIEEGAITNGNSIMFLPKHLKALPQTDGQVPAWMERTFSRSGARLVQSISKRMPDGRNRHLTKQYSKVEDIRYL
ncbi:hypothetical protein QR680_001440 [Steinernema hermaphroditum]|uniref:EGF-like domain-containing protein n=1 Tax=Steinernema hermaphroditum TaxID=289476 RepID=A0AA39LG38_9BILA|nr:hypothetical protein QR680_001440 [Steinernema hermaphroditum]